jgi:hypothetical protein
MARGAVAAFGMADHHQHRAVFPLLQQAAFAQLLLVAKVHDVRPRRQPGTYAGHGHQQADGGTDQLARASA